MQICLEGEVSKTSVNEGLKRGRRAAGDLIPWTIAQQYQDEDFPVLAGARVIRIATHPDYYGVFFIIYDFKETYISYLLKIMIYRWVMVAVH